MLCVAACLHAAWLCADADAGQPSLQAYAARGSAEAAALRIFGECLQTTAVRLHDGADHVRQEFVVFDLEDDAALRRAAAQRERRIVEERVCRQAGAEIAVEGDAHIAGCVDKRHAAVAHNGARAQKLGLHLEGQLSQQRARSFREHPVALSG